MPNSGDIVTDMLSGRSLFAGKQGLVIDDSSLPWKDDVAITVVFSPNCLPIPEVHNCHPEGFLVPYAPDHLRVDDEWRFESMSHGFDWYRALDNILRKNPNGRCQVGQCCRNQEKMVWVFVGGIICRMALCADCSDKISSTKILNSFPHVIGMCE
ncbi:MAG: hypothetical protein MRY49_01045 [Candidatus Pacebacteria bacterium]|nr:hypothetical protein [Candidatus Paceibacterota bacterium]